MNKVTTLTLPDVYGDYDIFVQVIDADGNLSSTRGCIVRYKIYEPVPVSSLPSGVYHEPQEVYVSLRNPDDTLSSAVVDANGTGVYYTLDGTMPTMDSYQYDGSSITIQSSSVILRLGYYVNGHNISGTPTYNYSINADVTPPVAVLSSVPIKHPNTNGATIVVSGYGVVAYKYAVVTKNSQIVVYGPPIQVETPITLTTFAISGTELFVIGCDEHDNWQVLPTVASWNYIAPFIVYGVPDEFTQITATNMHLEANGLTHYQYALNGTSYGVVTPIDTPLVLTDLDEGIYRVRIKGWFYGALNPYEYIVTWVVDTTPPTVVCYPPQGTYNNNPQFYFDLQCNEQATIYYTIDGTHPLATMVEFTGKVTIPVTPAATVSYLAVDRAGNMGSLGVTNYTILDISAPITQALPPTGAYPAGVVNPLFTIPPLNVYLHVNEQSTTYYGFTSNIDVGGPTTSIYTAEGISVPGNPGEIKHLYYFSIDAYGNREQLRTSTYQWYQWVPLPYRESSHVHVLSMCLNDYIMLATTFSTTSIMKLMNEVSTANLGLYLVSMAIENSESLRGNQQLMNRIASNIYGYLSSLYDISENIYGSRVWVTQIENSEALHGDQTIHNRITSSINLSVSNLHELSASSTGRSILVDSIAYGDGIYSMQALRNRITDNLMNRILGSNELSGSVAHLSTRLIDVSKGDPLTAYQAIRITLNPLVDILINALVLSSVSSGIKTSILEYGTYESGSELLQLVISQDPTLGTQANVYDIINTNLEIGMQAYLSSLMDLGASFAQATAIIYIDGIDVTNRVGKVTIKESTSEVHDDVNIECSDIEMYHLLNPVTYDYTPRIEIHVGTRVLVFTIEQRTGTEESFSVWGRSPSARIDTPYSDSISILLLEPKMVNILAEEIAGPLFLEWNACSWEMPLGYSFSGTRMEALLDLATQINAVVRSTSYGIEVRNRYPVHFNQLDISTPTYGIDRYLDMLELSYKDTLNPAYSKLDVYGYVDELDAPSLEVVEDNPFIGDIVHVKAYYTGNVGHTSLTYTSSGIAEYIGTDTEIIEKEEIVFTSGGASTSRPVTNLLSYSWLGQDGGIIEPTKYTNDLTSTGPGIALVTYTTTYELYKLSEHNVEVLLFELTAIPGIDYVLTILAENRDFLQAPELECQWVTDYVALQDAGLSWLDDNAYDVKELSISAPYNDLATDGIILSVENDRLNITGNAYLTEVITNIDGATIQQELTLVQRLL